MNLDVDAPIVPYAQPAGQGTVILHGVSLQDLGEAVSWGMSAESPGYTLQLSGGMKAGLPLANPNQSGLILAGTIFQAFGNWEGTEQHVAFVVTPSGYSPTYPGNFSLNWKQGITLGQALSNCLKIAYPTFPQLIKLNPNLVLNYSTVYVSSTLEGLASWVAEFTRKQFGDEVSIYLQNNVVMALDSTYQPKAKQIVFTDMVGQPTWIGVNELQIKFVMRADLNAGDLIQLPINLQSVPGIVQTSSSAFPSSVKYKSTFKGTFRINALRQIGDYRAADGASWVTVANCIPNG